MKKVFLGVGHGGSDSGAIAANGAKEKDFNLTMAQACQASIVASGGAGKMEDFLAAAQAGAEILLAASVFHFHLIDIGELKAYLKANNIDVRL